MVISLTYKETSEYVRKNNWIPKITNRDSWSTWKAMGAKSMRDLAVEEAKKILSENTEPVIAKDQAEEILKMARAYHKEAQERLKKQEGK